MNTQKINRYYHRYKATMVVEPVYAERFLLWSYNHTFGWLLTRCLLSRRWLTVLYGWLHKQSFSRFKIKAFVKKMAIDVGESDKSLTEFNSFNDFFIRRIDSSRRPIQSDPAICIAPADSRILVYQSIGGDQVFTIKNSRFNLGELLNDAELTKYFDGGALVICRIYLTDCHHFYFPDSGTCAEPRVTNGRYYTVSAYGRRYPSPFYQDNYRLISLFASDHFGLIAIVEIGAFTVGSIQQRFSADVFVAKGQHKGYFELGGSTVVLLFGRNKIQLDDDLLNHSQAGLETYVHFGDSIGRTYDAD